MADEPYFTPGQSDGQPKGESPWPQVPTQFTPQKPVGPDPVSPSPLPEGSEIERHVQVFGFDQSSGNFRPVNWVDGKLSVDAVFSGSISIGTIKIQDATNPSNIVAVDADGAMHITAIEKINPYPTQTAVTHDANGLVSTIVETDGAHTMTSTITHNADGTVASIAEAYT